MVSLDYCFLVDGHSPVLVIKCYADAWLAAHAVQSKGLDPYAIKCLARFLVGTGFKRVAIKSDDEEPIKALKREAIKVARQEVELEASPEESQAYTKATA
eukprot:2730325-Amphidinium_carterae.1